MSYLVQNTTFWGCRIYQLHLCRGGNPPNECLAYDTKQSDGEVPVMLGLWGMQSTPSLPLLSGPLWPVVVAPDRAVVLYASHGAQCGVTTSHSTCYGYCVHDYHISFRLFALSNPSVPTLCLKDPQKGVDTIQPDLL